MKVVGRKVLSKKIMFDPESGQPVEMILIGKLDQEPLDKGFVKVFNVFLDSILKDKELAGKSVRLLLYMLQRLEYNSLQITITQQEASGALDIGRKTYYRWLQTLQKKGIIEKVGNNIYRLKPFAVVKGEMWRALKDLA